ncbi:PIKK family atypical protein kinase [Tritrichomonas foetus]|uniref:Serine/threonine-protein kinase TOR n=1 Tax=Tritrichomonas foetus TaxID=1144522 RepID=A0A1J4J753_9EUKA|nr:PIKK family atypical protein kinase [Tritrichomonas foetus]|eukprot:OHS95000.1 PIKK family atypical protein kinase [Tritrichomonas foetus]
MNLIDLPIPKTCNAMIETFETYYNTFYIEMVRMSNTALQDYIETYIDLLTTMSKTLNSADLIRVSIGVISLHTFGYNNFLQLSQLFDRLIPQTDLEYVRFTSWCAGILIHHPREDQSRYVAHLVERAIGWIRAKGRRARALAAVNLLHVISRNAGNASVLFLPNLKSAGWELVSHPSQQVLRDTAECLRCFTLALMRYGRSEIQSYLDFFYHLCDKLLAFGNPIKEYAALLILQNFMQIYPDYFISKIQDMWNLFIDAYDHSSENILIQSASFCTSVCICVVDPKFFVDSVADEVMAQAEDLILEFEKETVKYLQLMIEKVPDYMIEKIDVLKSMARSLLDNQFYDPALKLLCTCINVFQDKLCPFDMNLLEMALKAPMTSFYTELFVSFFKITSAPLDQIKKSLIDRISDELKSNNQLEPLKMVADLPPIALEGAGFLYNSVSALTTHENTKIRSAVPKALYNIAVSTKSISFDALFKGLIKFATYEDNLHVRQNVLQVLYEHCSIEMATPEYLNILKIFVNDDSNSVRQTSLKILAKLKEYNPMYVTSITRHAILDYFFILNQVTSIRQRSRIAKILPDLIHASSSAVPTYSEVFLRILIKAFQDPQVAKFNNFIEETANTTILIGLADSLATLAPYDPAQVSKYLDQIVPQFCAYLVPTEHRTLISSILKAFLVLLTPPCSNVDIRTKVPTILSACSSLLANTRSRAIRKMILRVTGAIGIIEVHQKPLEKIAATPENIDEDLARQFYHPLRDTEGLIDETMLLNPKEVSNYYTVVAASSLLTVFKDSSLKDLRYDAAQALVNVLHSPKMSALSYFDEFVAHFLEILEQCSIEEMKLFLPLYSELVSSSTNNTIPFVERSLRLIHNRFCDELMIDFFNLIRSFLQALGHGFSEFASETICLLVVVLDSWKTINADVCRGVLEIFSILGTFAVDHQYLIIPQICDAIDCQQSLPIVRVMALDSLRILVSQADLGHYFGPIIRSLSFALTLNDDMTRDAAKNLLYAVHDKGESFIGDDSLNTLEDLWTTPVESKEVRELINNMKESKPPSTHVRSLHFPLPDTTKGHVRAFSEDAVLSRIVSPNLGVGKHLENWLMAFVVTLISSSPVEQIRECATVANAYKPLASDLVSIAFHSCWQQMSNKGKLLITSSFRELLLAKENYENVAREIFKILVFMHKVGQPLDIGFEDIIESSKRYGATPFALKLGQEDLDRRGGRVKIGLLSQLIDIYLQMGNWTNAAAVWKMCESKKASNKELFVQLKMWDLAAEEYKKGFEGNRGDPSTFVGLIHSLSEQEKWNDVISYLPVFESQKRHLKHETSVYFASAALQLGRWDDLDNILQYAPQDSLHVTTLHALNSLHHRNWKKVTQYVDNGFAILASRPIRFFSDQQRIHRETMFAAQKLIEINEMMTWLQTNDESLKQNIQSVWKARLKTAPSDFELWFKLISERVQITQIRDETLIKFFQMHSVSLGTKMHNNTFDILFPNFSYETSPDLDKLCYTISKWHTGDQKTALELMEKLLETVSTSLKQKCAYLYADWVVENDESNDAYFKAYKHLKNAIESSDRTPIKEVQKKVSIIDKSPPVSPHLQRFTPFKTALVLPTHMMKDLVTGENTEKLLRKWASVNVSLTSIDDNNLESYVTNAIHALIQCCRIAPSFPDLVQLLHIFFENATIIKIFNNTAKDIFEKLSASLLLEAAPQLLIQLAHPSPNVSSLVHQIIMSMLPNHFHSLIFSIIVMTFSKNSRRSEAAEQILNEFKNYYPNIYSEVTLIRNSLLTAAVTWYEFSSLKVSDAINFFKAHQPDQAILTLIEYVNELKSPKCEMHYRFLEMYDHQLKKLSSILENDSNVDQLIQWCDEVFPLFNNEVARVQLIQLKTISQELCEKRDFALAVPGTYKPDKPLIHIKYFVDQFGVYMSKQQPKDVVIKGEDGLFYQYLLKGHEDLRLDERIMQFFKLINSYIKKESIFGSNHIQTMHVIPLSLEHGLVQWIPGTDTLRSIVMQYRGLYNRDPTEEIHLLSQYGFDRYDTLIPVQKMQILSKIFREVPDTDLANFLWIKASSADIWHKQTETFAVTTAMTSIVGYIIGLGERHPSNLLIDRFTGKVVHIDFGDCFERASKRSYLPEDVPFRLTRMMIKAMGITGIHGTFRTSFVNMSSLLRENRNVLMMVLSIFVHEPLIDPEGEDKKTKSEFDNFPMMKRSTSSTFTLSAYDDGKVYTGEYPKETQLSSIELRRRIKEKLRGTDFEEGKVLSVEEQADRLISMATNTYNLAKLYHGWYPFW